MLKIAFCDDETQETRRLEALLEEYAADRGQDFAHTSYQSPVELMAEVEKGTRFDIILLDVLMPGENGMAAAREIREYDSNVKIIFLTSSTEFAVESYAVDAWYYQLKPIRREDFFRLMDSACAACTREQRHSLILRSKSGIVRLELEELVYCEVMGRTLTFHLNNGVVLESMGRLDDLCDSSWNTRISSVPTAPSLSIWSISPTSQPAPSRCRTEPWCRCPTGSIRKRKSAI